ncbi:MAG: hypothetical protein ACK5XZ_05580 [Hyphomonadaceae bacterium]|jgi:hypothetical protein|uniref:hypothetical protein n=1 Tax=Aquidulcibacter sp. TaxID=2052990 RepID=UPI0022CAA00D|nr:hypothetical protein [Aquidulcibacter sp.]MCE2890346.1 hypothetical protein [Hyphomonadaceae bacterium]MCZ8210061.1 hypothetical protein [Aquidulcibacter sp.]
MSDLSLPIGARQAPDFRLTLAILLTLVLQAIAALLWVGAAAQRLDNLESEIKLQKPILERMARIEAQVAAVRSSLDRIENHIDQEAK